MIDPNDGQIFSIVFRGGRDGHVRITFEGMSPEREAEVKAMTPEQMSQKLTHTEFWALQGYMMTSSAMEQAADAEYPVEKEKPS